MAPTSEGDQLQRVAAPPLVNTFTNPLNKREDVIEQNKLKDKVNSKGFVIPRVEKGCMGY